MIDLNKATPKYRGWHRWLPAFALIFIASILALALFYEPPTPPSLESELTDTQYISETGFGARPTWLSPLMREDPAHWLASWPGTETPAVEQLTQSKDLLRQARQHFDEDPRMIANRSVQVAEMLQDLNAEEHPVNVLADLLETVSADSRTIPFAELCQHYIVIRRQGQPRMTALKTLAENYRYDMIETDSSNGKK